jgi:hypothetical protein
MKLDFIKIMLVVVALLLAANLVQNYRAQTVQAATTYQLVPISPANMDQAGRLNVNGNIVAAVCQPGMSVCTAIVR